MKSIIKILIGIMMLVTVAVGYIPTPEYLVEFTCVSNTLGGILLIIDGILNFKNKSVPGILYLNVCAGILFVFLICLGSLSGMYHMNYKGAFFFLHAVNPVLLTLCYILTKKDDAKNLWKHLAGAPVLLLLYLLFDYILGNCRGYFVYGFCTPEQLSIGIALLVELIMYAVLWLFALGMFKLNQRIGIAKLS